MTGYSISYPKSSISVIETADLNKVGRSYYCFCLEQAIINVKQARALVRGDVTEDNHELPRIIDLLEEALRVS